MKKLKFYLFKQVTSWDVGKQDSSDCGDVIMDDTAVNGDVSPNSGNSI